MDKTKNHLCVVCTFIILICGSQAPAAEGPESKEPLQEDVSCTAKVSTFTGDVQIESYADWTKQVESIALGMVKNLGQEATPENIKQAKIGLARRAAQAKLRALAMAYDRGIMFVYELSANKWQSLTQGISKGMTEKGVQAFDDGLVVLKGEFKRSPEESVNGYVKTCEVTGKVKMIKNNLYRAAEDARNSAFISVVRSVGAERYGGKIPEKLTGRLLYMDTISSEQSGDDYSLRLRVTVALDSEN